jgi:cell division initiation protein
MRITPIEIRQKTFEKNFRGYEKDEVNAFLLTLSQEWERLNDENKELRIRLEGTEREVTKLREVESSLYKTLKTAEDTGAHVIEQARVTAELHLKESHLKAEALLNEAKSKAKDTIEESEVRSKEIVAEMEDRVKALVENYKKLESAREDLLSDLKRLANEMLERVERSKLMSKDFNPDQHLAIARKEAKRIAFPNVDFDKPFKPEQVKIEPVKMEPPKEKAHEPKASAEQEKAIEMSPQVVDPQPVFNGEGSKKIHKSFFDEIG